MTPHVPEAELNFGARPVHSGTARDTDLQNTVCSELTLFWFRRFEQELPSASLHGIFAQLLRKNWLTFQIKITFE